ncbi:MAG: TolC family protein [Verrucomicrobiota bacterium]
MLLVPGGVAFASQSKPLSLEECLKIALEHNLDLKIARYNPRIARYNVALAYTRYDPVFSGSDNRNFSSSPGGIDEESRPYVGTETTQDSFRVGVGGSTPVGLSYDVSAQSGATRGSGPGGPFENANGSVSLQLRQPLLRNSWIDSARLSIQLSKRQLKITELGLRQQIMNVATSTELAYYDLILARENLKVQEQALELAQQLLAANRRRVALGLLPALDEKQSESQVAARQASLQAAQRALVTQEYALKSLLSDDLTAWQEISIVPTETLAAVPVLFDLQSSWRNGLTQRPDILQSRTSLERQGIVLKYLRNQLFPQLDVVGSYGYRGSKREYSGALDDIGRGNSPFYSVGATLTFPLGNRAARENYRIGRADEEQLVLQVKRQEQDIMVQIAVAVEQAKSTLRQVESTKQARQFAEIALNAEQKKLETGKSTSFIVLQLQRDLTGARVAELQALADYNRALAQLALREGATLERHQIQLEVE